MDLIFSSAGCITGLFYFLVVLFSKTKQINRYFLISFIAALITSLLPMLLSSFRIFPPIWLNASFGLLWGPILYFYISSLLKKQLNFKYFILHALPFLAYYVLTVFLRFEILPGPPEFNLPNNSNQGIELVFTVIQSLSLLGYSIVALLMLNNHHKNIQNHFSYEDVHLTIRWSYVIILFFVLAYLLVAITQVFIPEYLRVIPFDIHIVLISVFIYVLGYLGTQQQPVYLNMNEVSKVEIEEKSRAISKEKYSKNKLNENLKEVYKSKLIEHLSKDKPYLNPKLSIDDLSEALEIPKHFISQIINNSLNHTFYSLINFYRVAEVKKLIANDKDEKYTLLAIAFDSGFNSKSGFNKNFKLETGITPFEYRKSVNY